SVQWIGSIGQPHDWEDFEAIASQLALSVPVVRIEGGSSRQESVYRGLLHLKTLDVPVERVAVHDGARCLATPDLFDRCNAALDECDGAIAAIPVKDTIKQVKSSESSEELRIDSTPDRSLLWAAQTPQCFRFELLLAAHERARQEGWEVTDDASIFERAGLPVRVVAGEETNLKMTTPLDLTIASAILQQRHG
ncbi:MAG: 2-C-methyl-D-erythritol 4-phosphate cytidylyltransferase, partial [Cyanobacteria bacterium J06639_1]